jgi:hypothetical protein
MKDLRKALESFNEHGKIALVVGVDSFGANSVAELRIAFERGYKEMYGGEVMIELMQRNEKTRGLLIMILSKKDSDENVQKAPE